MYIYIYKEMGHPFRNKWVSDAIAKMRGANTENVWKCDNPRGDGQGGLGNKPLMKPYEILGFSCQQPLRGPTVTVEQ